MRSAIFVIAATVGLAAIAGGIMVYRKIATKRNAAAAVKKPEYDDAKEEFIKNAKAFVGIFEPIYKISIGRVKSKRSVFADWDVRVGNLSGANSFQALWRSDFSGFDSWNEDVYTEKAKQLLNLLRSFGIERTGESEFMVDTDTYKQYSTLDGEVIEIGNMVKVISPCWLLNGNALEKGFIDAVQ